jgi:hypothetical protein
MIRRVSQVFSFIAISLTSCTSQDSSISEKISAQVHASSTAPLDFTLIGPNGWERVCVFGPYTTNDLVEADLGFKWDSDAQSSISVDDGINLIVFTQGKKVLAFVDHKRRGGDFESEKNRCTSRAVPILNRSMRSDGVPLFTMPK